MASLAAVGKLCAWGTRRGKGKSRRCHAVTPVSPAARIAAGEEKGRQKAMDLPPTSPLPSLSAAPPSRHAPASREAGGPRGEPPACAGSSQVECSQRPGRQGDGRRAARQPCAAEGYEPRRCGCAEAIVGVHRGGGDEAVDADADAGSFVVSFCLHRLRTATWTGCARTSGLRAGRVKGAASISNRSPSRVWTPSEKERVAVPKKWTCTSPARRNRSYLK